MSHFERTVPIHPLAPNKVSEGTACNGCGVCCLFEPCPLGIVLTGSRSGACDAVLWDDTVRQYRCGAIVSPHTVLLKILPKYGHGLLPVLTPVLRQLGLRWISAGTGCDSHLEVMRNNNNFVYDTTVKNEHENHHD